MWMKNPQKSEGLEAKLEKGKGKIDCNAYTCNPVNLTIYTHGEWKKKNIYGYGIQIHQKGEDPGIILDIRVKEESRESSKETLVFHSFYHEIENGVVYEILAIAKNLFINLAETIAKIIKCK